MKRWKKLSIALLLLLAVTQVPFAYRRYRLGVLETRIQALRAERGPLRKDDYADYRGIIHVHSRLGGHSLGDPEEIITAARENDLRFVVMTEHSPRTTAGAAAALRGTHGGVVFLDGSETLVGDGRALLIPGMMPIPRRANLTMEEAVRRNRVSGSLALLAYPEGLPLSSFESYDGLEIYNAYTASVNAGRLWLMFDMLWSHRRYGNLIATYLYSRPEENLTAWDQLNSAGNRKLIGVAGIDAHANIGLVLETHAAQPLVDILFDRYTETFGIVRDYVVLKNGQRLDESTVLDAIRDGHVYIGFDLFADSGGFRFKAEGKDRTVIMGDEIALGDLVRLVAFTPQRARVVLLRDGVVEQSGENAEHHEFTVHQRGAYRVEVYLDQLGIPASAHPWILSNPIYVR